MSVFALGFTPLKSRQAQIVIAGAVLVAASLNLSAPRVRAQSEPPPREGDCADNPFPDVNPGPGSLKRVPVPEAPNLNEFIKDRRYVVMMGKALFWDMQVGSDGIQACASCHFPAGADPRSKNQFAPIGKSESETTFQIGRPNYQLLSSNFPFHKLSDPTNRQSTVIQSFNEVTSSAGVKLKQFIGVEPGASQDNGTHLPDSTFHVRGFNTRRVEPRNTPTVINAVFNRRNLWDGRGDPIFNGVNEFGVRDPKRPSCPRRCRTPAGIRQDPN